MGKALRPTENVILLYTDIHILPIIFIAYSSAPSKANIRCF